MNNRDKHYFDNHKFNSLFNLTGMTQGEFGKRVGVTGASVSHYINGHSNPTEKTLNKMCVVLKCNYSDLKKAKSSSYVYKPGPILIERQPTNAKDTSPDLIKQLVALSNDDNAAVVMKAIKAIMEK